MNAPGTFPVGAAVLDFATRLLAGPSGEVRLKPQLAHLLAELAREPGAIVGTRRLIAAIYADRSPAWPEVDRELVFRSVLAQAKRVLREVGAEGAIQNVRNTGYRVVPTRGPWVVRLYTPGQAAVADAAVAAMETTGRTAA